MWDLLNQLYKRFGLWAFLAIGFVFATVWAVAHITAQPCEQVSILFDLIEYKKACKGDDPPPNHGCQTLRQHLEMNGEQQAQLRREIGHLESAVTTGDRDAQHALEKTLGRLSALEREGQGIKAQIQSRCPGQ